ncbi:hypothetical protein [Mycobacterium palustre]|nr:hypothetical protein [Mycobacterium palustre]
MTRTPQEVSAHRGNRVDDGVDAFVLRDAVSSAQSIHHTPRREG